MWIYHVQLSSLDHDIEVVADANPEEEYEREQNQTFLVFKRNDEIVGRLILSAVIGWWYNN